MNLPELVQLSKAENQDAGYDVLASGDKAQIDLAAARLELALDIRRGDALEVLVKLGAVLVEGIPPDRYPVNKEASTSVQLSRHTSDIAGVFRGSIVRECP